MNEVLITTSVGLLTTFLVIAWWRWHNGPIQENSNPFNPAALEREKEREMAMKKALEAEIAIKKATEISRANEIIIEEKYSNLQTPSDILAYIKLNSHNLPDDEGWPPLLFDFISELLEAGWTPKNKISYKHKWYSYNIRVEVSSEEIEDIIMKYEDLAFENYDKNEAKT